MSRNMKSEVKGMNAFVKSVQNAQAKYEGKDPVLKPEFKRFNATMINTGERAKELGRKLAAGMGMDKACFPVK